MTFSVDNIILIFAVLLTIGVMTAKFSSRLGLPSLVFFIAVGMVLSHYIYFDNAKLAQLFGVIALIIIIFDGGLQTKWTDVRKIIVPSSMLATIGVFVTTIIIGVFAKYVLGLTWLEGLLFGAIVGSTDAAAVFAVLGNKNIKKRLTSTLEAESGTNDPMAVFLTVTIIHLIGQPETGFFGLILRFFWEMGFGLAAGLLFGKLAVWVINKINLDSSGLYPVLSLAMAVLTYALTTAANASGLLAVYVMAVIVGNSDLTFRHSIIRFNEGLAWMMQILMFILLGLLVFPNQLVDIVWEGLLLSIVLMIVARPAGVFLSMIASKFSLKEKLFISWAGLRGAVPIVLATYPMLAGLENSQLIFNVVFFVVLTSALLQGATLTPLANKLKLSESKKNSVPHSLELISIGRTNNEMVELEVGEGAAVSGKELKDIELPNDALITAVIRNEKLHTPRGETNIFSGDTLYILVSKKNREKIKAIFQGDGHEAAESSE
ncbi:MULTISPECIES: potassium/proton antiporter [Metabacillus]|uniref:Potassium transporter n=1 Tax=Metabacillus indicus TaxID=246786 RepID=A0A084GJ04_METID|nr:MULTISPECIES: potassium/proton antiporter [Metabacillus]KEZ47014.1 potassium transporter [Metabacillus indicus LMG 22858]KEZ47316.1 potassium transporter [Metabacillus indicus]